MSTKQRKNTLVHFPTFSLSLLVHARRTVHVKNKKKNKEPQHAKEERSKKGAYGVGRKKKKKKKTYIGGLALEALDKGNTVNRARTDSLGTASEEQTGRSRLVSGSPGTIVAVVSQLKNHLHICIRGALDY